MDKVGEQLPAIGTALAGLILVFLGVIVTAWDGYDKVAQKSVRTRFQLRVRLAFSAFLFSILAAALGMVGIGTSHKSVCCDEVGTLFLGVSGVLTVVLAFLIIREI